MSKKVVYGLVVVCFIAALVVILALLPGALNTVSGAAKTVSEKSGDISNKVREENGQTDALRVAKERFGKENPEFKDPSYKVATEDEVRDYYNTVFLPEVAEKYIHNVLQNNAEYELSYQFLIRCEDESGKLIFSSLYTVYQKNGEWKVLYLDD